MDYTMDTLSLEGVRQYGERYEAAVNSDTTMELGENFSRTVQSNAMNKMGAEPDSQRTILKLDLSKSIGKDFQASSSVYDAQQSLSADLLPAQSEASMQRAMYFNNGRVSLPSHDGISEQLRVPEKQTYYSDGRLIPENLAIEEDEAEDRLASYYENNGRSIEKTELVDQSQKIVRGIGGPFVSDFLQEITQTKDINCMQDISRVTSSSVNQGQEGEQKLSNNSEQPDPSLGAQDQNSNFAQNMHEPGTKYAENFPNSVSQCQDSAFNDSSVKNSTNLQMKNNTEISFESSYADVIPENLSSSHVDTDTDCNGHSEKPPSQADASERSGESNSGNKEAVVPVVKRTKRKRDKSLVQQHLPYKKSKFTEEDSEEDVEEGYEDKVYKEFDESTEDEKTNDVSGDLDHHELDNSREFDDDDETQSSDSEFSLSKRYNKKKFKCKICNKSWKLKKDLNNHMKSHPSAKKYACSVCNTSFQTKSTLSQHMSTHVDSKPYPCPECNVIFQSTADLKEHKKTHIVTRAFKCSECTYSAKRKKDLRKHMLVHSATKDHYCQYCKFSSKRKYSLLRHMKTAHSSEKLYECSICSFKTSAVDSFKVHVAMHASTRTVVCIICGTVIRKRPTLIEHLLGHTVDPDQACKECDEVCSTTYEYMLHLLSHKEIDTTVSEDLTQSSIFDLSASVANGSAELSYLGSDFLARHSKLIMDTPTMEVKIGKMSDVASRLADMTKVISLLNEKNKVVLQLGEISTLATELAVLSGNVLQSYKNMYNIFSGTKTKSASSSYEADEDTSLMDDDFGNLSAVLNMTASIKQELQDGFPTSESEAGMQIQVDLNGEPVSCIQKEDSYRKSKLGDKSLKCNRCNLMFTDTRSLKRHLMAHDDVRPYACEKCGQSFRRNEHLKKHMVTHSDERPFTCKDCPYAAKTEHRLKIHMLCHSQTKAYSCHHCTYTARTNYELNHHMKRHEPRSCSQCNFVCYSRPELKKHVFTHSSFDCSECDFKTNDRAEYSKHSKKHSLVQHLCCELCGYSCDTMKKFKYHKLRHENKTPYQCQDCDYKCSSRASFDCHRLKHAGLKPYLCSFCGAAFRKTSHLNQHLLIHKDEKAFKCSECGYACRTKHNLKEHEMTHSGEKPFACKYCSFSCRRNKALQLHMLKHESHSMVLPQMQLPLLQMTMQMPMNLPLMSPL
ncbi:zinc finger protein 780B-like [Physella acuta]|uniref:zinc finger protein 780B-like n=1 Tax=Physella acuta TaxID=109671 RepID=UPI0027DD176E|nr:zinc finger protein 780B-like [Physella acuta]XP_059157360.1 zinc finger protein 780B-like [Physella acuta]XP_059157361.1 zinc finger protein 780B-like [Physella acuta]